MTAAISGTLMEAFAFTALNSMKVTLGASFF